jgi:DNA polymerase-4
MVQRREPRCEVRITTVRTEPLSRGHRRATIAAVPTTTILHADMDAFYAAVEQRDRPELRGRPVIVSGQSSRSVVLTASYEARRFGVRSAMPAVHARRLCPQGVFVAPRMAHYVAVACDIRRVFEEFTPLVEPLSLDEAFLDITGSLRLFHDASHLATQLKARVRAVTGLTASVGIGPTKMVAKIASGRSKPDGLLEIAPAQVDDFLRPLPVKELWGVGPVLQQTLHRLGVDTIGALADAEPRRLERDLGAHGRALWELAHGRDRSSVDPDRQRQSYGEEETFARDLRDGPIVQRTIAARAEAVAARLRADHCRGRTVTLKVKLAQRTAPGKYPVLTRRLTLPAAADDGAAITAAALQLWTGIKDGLLIRLIGVSVSGIEASAAAQLSLFSATESRRTALNAAVDQLTARFGGAAVTRGDVPLKPATRRNVP